MKLREYVAEIGQKSNPPSPRPEPLHSTSDETPSGTTSAPSASKEKKKKGIEELQPYLRMWVYERDHPDLADDFPNLPPCLHDRLSKELPRALLPDPAPRYLFLSPARAFTDLHVDPWLANVWFMQCDGAKTFEQFASWGNVLKKKDQAVEEEEVEAREEVPASR